MCGKEKQAKGGNSGGWRDSSEVKILRKLLQSKLMYLFIAVAFILFLVTRSPLFSMLSVGLILIMLIGESVIGASEHGAKSEAYEIVIAIVAALAIWFGSSFLLSTPAPLNAIVSCSMLPNLERGDLVILQGAEPKGFDVSVDRFNYEDISVNVEGKGTFSTGYSLAQYCVAYPASIPCSALIQTPEKVTESYGPLDFKFGWCGIRVQGAEGKVVCAKSVSVNGKEYPYDLSGDTIVYSTLPNDGFSRYSGGSKEIIHRVFLKVHSGAETYYITKGDNNELFDIQFSNTPAVPKRTSGKVLVRIPYLGYFKLFLFGFFADPAGCDRVFITR